VEQLHQFGCRPLAAKHPISWLSTMSKSGHAVLVIDDEPQIRRFLRAEFELQGFAVREAENAAEGLKSVIFTPPDLVILDLGLPDLSGSEVHERIRSWSNVPIIILSVNSNEQEKVRLLRLGADDYIVKPFGIAELMARSDAALRRYFKGPTKDSVVRVDPLMIDLVSLAVTLSGKRLQLTRKEHRLLHVLSTHAGLVVTHQQLVKDIWGTNLTHNIQYLRILVRKIPKAHGRPNTGAVRGHGDEGADRPAQEARAAGRNPGLDQGQPETGHVRRHVHAGVPGRSGA
jgi:two-component system KDP operon response regulator KdpE